jgi:hypothetical protein
MPGRWRLKNLMAWVAIVAIYLAAFRLVATGPSDDPWAKWSQGIACVLLFCVMPLHVASAWTTLTAAHDEERGDA